MHIHGYFYSLVHGLNGKIHNLTENHFRRTSVNSEFKSGWVKNQLQNIFGPTDNRLAMKLFGSKKAFMKESRMRPRVSRPWIIHPMSTFRWGFRSMSEEVQSTLMKKQTNLKKKSSKLRLNWVFADFGWRTARPSVWLKRNQEFARWIKMILREKCNAADRIGLTSPANSFVQNTFNANPSVTTCWHKIVQDNGWKKHFYDFYIFTFFYI